MLFERWTGPRVFNCQSQCLTETWSFELKTEASIKRRLLRKRFEFFWALAYEKTQIRHDLPPLLSRILCSSLLFVHGDLFSVCFPFCISFLRCSSLDIRFYTYVFSCSLSRSFRRILLILVSSLTFLRVFLDSLYVFYFLFFLSRSVPYFSSYLHSKASLHKL